MYKIVSPHNQFNSTFSTKFIRISTDNIIGIILIFHNTHRSVFIRMMPIVSMNSARELIVKLFSNMCIYYTQIVFI